MVIFFIRRRATEHALSAHNNGVIVITIICYYFARVKRDAAQGRLRRTPARPVSHEFKAIEMCVVTAAAVDLVRTRTTHVSVSFVCRDVGGRFASARLPSDSPAVRQSGSFKRADFKTAL